MRNSGKVSLAASDIGDARVAPAKLLETAKGIRLANPGVLTVARKGQDDGSISLHFEGDGWKLSGIRLPSAVLDALSRHLPAPG